VGKAGAYDGQSLVVVSSEGTFDVEKGRRVEGLFEQGGILGVVPRENPVAQLQDPLILAIRIDAGSFFQQRKN
jgi:hypothetical protein